MLRTAAKPPVKTATKTAEGGSQTHPTARRRSPATIKDRIPKEKQAADHRQNVDKARTQPAAARKHREPQKRRPQGNGYQPDDLPDQAQTERPATTKATLERRERQQKGNDRPPQPRTLSSSTNGRKPGVEEETTRPHPTLQGQHRSLQRQNPGTGIRRKPRKVKPTKRTEERERTARPHPTHHHQLRNSQPDGATTVNKPADSRPRVRKDENETTGTAGEATGTATAGGANPRNRNRSSSSNRGNPRTPRRKRS